MNKNKELEDQRNPIDKLVSRDLKEKMLALIDNEAKIKPISGKANSIDILVSKRLKMRRVMLGISQQDIGKAVDVSIQQVQKYEKGINRISSGKLFTLAKFLKVPITYFYEAEGSNEQIDNITIEDINIPNEKEIIHIIQVFNGIKSSQSRKKIIELIKVIS